MNARNMGNEYYHYHKTGTEMDIGSETSLTKLVVFLVEAESLANA